MPQIHRILQVVMSQIEKNYINCNATNTQNPTSRDVTNRENYINCNATNTQNPTSRDVTNRKKNKKL